MESNQLNQLPTYKLSISTIIWSVEPNHHTYLGNLCSHKLFISAIYCTKVGTSNPADWFEEVVRILILFAYYFYIPAPHRTADSIQSVQVPTHTAPLSHVFIRAHSFYNSPSFIYSRCKYLRVKLSKYSFALYTFRIYPLFVI